MISGCRLSTCRKHQAAITNTPDICKQRRGAGRRGGCFLERGSLRRPGSGLRSARVPRQLLAAEMAAPLRPTQPPSPEGRGAAARAQIERVTPGRAQAPTKGKERVTEPQQSLPAPRTLHAEAVKEPLPPRAAAGRRSARRRRLLLLLLLLFFVRLPLLGRRSERRRVGEPAAPARLRQRLRACAGGCVRGVRASSRGLVPSAGRAAAVRPGGRGAEAPPACVTVAVTVAGVKTPVSAGEGNQIPAARPAKHLPGVLEGSGAAPPQEIQVS